MAQRRESALTAPKLPCPVNRDDRIQSEDDVEDQGGVEEVPLDVLVSVTGVPAAAAAGRRRRPGSLRLRLGAAAVTR
jgi:hypothetical protein